MSRTSSSSLAALLCTILWLSFCPRSHGQWLGGNLSDSTNRADYIVVTTTEYVNAVQPLAAFRSGHQSLSVVTVLVDSITAQFRRATPDSSIRDFVTRALTHWQMPRPRFLLLAGNIDIVPSHKVASPLAPFTTEDSLMIDQWFVSEESETQQKQVPGVALGRLPAWSTADLSTMVSKTIAYEQTPVAGWAARSIAVADSSDFGYFEGNAALEQQSTARRWPDTVTIHARPNSPAYKPPSQFLELWGEGSAIVNFVGHMNGWQFSHGAYFRRSDIDSLANGSSLSLCLSGGSQRFEVRDSIPIAVALLQAPGRGGVCVIAPSGLAYESDNVAFATSLFTYLSAHPNDAIGTAWMSVKQQQSDFDGRRTLFGDPALVIKSSTIASIDDRGDKVPVAYGLQQNFPNPFNPTTVIRYELPVAGEVKLVVYDLLGREVAVLVNERKMPGTYTVRFDANGLASGMYFYRLQIENFVQTRKMMVMK